VSRVLEYVVPTKRSHMSKARAARIFVARNGICGICGVQIRGEAYEIEHPDPLWAGGSDDDAELWPVHVKCHAPKTAAESGQRAKRDRIVTAGWAGKPRSKLSKEYRREVLRKLGLPRTGGQ
jgi:5-methylcytosine-specific restriction endonuclease McrA